MDIMTMAMSQPKVIDFDKLGITPLLNELLAKGGGGEIAQIPALWEELNTKKLIKVQFAAGDLLAATTDVTVAYHQETGLPVSFSVTAVLNQDNGVIIRITSTFLKYPSDLTAIASRVEMLEIP